MDTPLTGSEPVMNVKEAWHDHEKRIRSLEEFKAKALGALALAAAMGGLFGSLLGKLFVK